VCALVGSAHLAPPRWLAVVGQWPWMISSDDVTAMRARGTGRGAGGYSTRAYPEVHPVFFDMIRAISPVVRPLRDSRHCQGKRERKARSTPPSRASSTRDAPAVCDHDVARDREPKPNPPSASFDPVAR